MLTPFEQLVEYLDVLFTDTSIQNDGMETITKVFWRSLTFWIDTSLRDVTDILISYPRYYH
jgi:hypothetical protein